MAKKKRDLNEVNQILRDLFPSETASQSKLRKLFEQKLFEDEFTFNQAVENLGIDFKSLNGYLDGNFKKLDIVILQKIASYLETDLTIFLEEYIESINPEYRLEIEESKKRAFILNNFDLIGLKKMKFIDNTKDFKQIEEKINLLFGFESIYEYRQEEIHPAFSRSKRRPVSELPKDLWVRTALTYFRRTPNPYEFEMEGLLEYFPSIRWHSMDVEKGLLQVTRSLFKYGVTVIFVPYVVGANVRGATISFDGKPCIAITNYTNYYPSLWFALIHELHHVLFDWEEISTNRYHVSGEFDLFTMKEQEADNFARDYLFSKEKMDIAKTNIEDKFFIEKFAYENHVHPSIIYAFYAYNHSDDPKIWAKIKRYMPDNSVCLKALINNPWQNAQPIRKICNQIKDVIFKS